MPALRELLAEIADEARHLLALTDAGGRLLWIEGSARVRSSAADETSFVEGALEERRSRGRECGGYGYRIGPRGPCVRRRTFHRSSAEAEHTIGLKRACEQGFRRFRRDRPVCLQTAGYSAAGVKS